MFPARMFAPRFFPPRFFAEAGAEAVAVAGIYFAPRMFAPRMFAPRFFPGAADDESDVDLPSSLLAAIRRRFYADAALTAAIPGGLLPGIPPGSTDLPWAVIVPVGEAEGESATGPGGASLWREEFQISVTCRSDQAKADPTSGNEDACWAAKRLFYRAFNYKGDASDLDWEDGWCLSITPTNAHLSPEPEKTKGNVLARQIIFTLKALTARVF